MLFFITLYFSNILSTLSLSNNECYDAWECLSQELIGDTLCYGYQACQSSSIISSYYVSCAGYESCIYSTVISMNTIACDGDYACSNAHLSSQGIIIYISLSGQNRSIQFNHKPCSELNIIFWGDTLYHIVTQL